MRIILSKDRAAQLDLLLRSLERNAPPEPTAIIYRTSDGAHALGYSKLFEEHRPSGLYLYPDHGNFERHVKELLAIDVPTVTFLCDDDILYRPLPPVVTTNEREPTIALRSRDDLLCFSLRLGANTGQEYPSDGWQEAPLTAATGEPWHWKDAPEHNDFGYPGSLDGHTFRTADLRRMLAGRKFPNPTALECALVEGCNDLADERPLMACYPHSVLVGNPINRVSEQSNVRYGTRFPVTADECNRRFLAGKRIGLDRLDFSGVNGAHSEIELVWE